ncbi:hypothetical protein [Pedobacter rhodius]|uniref:HEPN AbiU2-like domain-containing protein n=1 Tax=Pedobacter rhodius TaxID=3004098 RepID=A0ABT4KSU7_9SPHI|nr:hypothetical protein [Pedobacter sp. SJ11]MCZ4222011.1 hypothetical protein [Pedobacter sp. SJ11]
MDDLSLQRVRILIRDTMRRIESISNFEYEVFMKEGAKGLSIGVVMEYYCQQIEILIIKCLILVEKRGKHSIYHFLNIINEDNNISLEQKQDIANKVESFEKEHGEFLVDVKFARDKSMVHLDELKAKELKGYIGITLDHRYLLYDLDNIYSDIFKLLGITYSTKFKRSQQDIEYVKMMKLFYAAILTVPELKEDFCLSIKHKN